MSEKYAGRQGVGSWLMREVTRGPVDTELRKRAKWMVNEMNLVEEIAPEELVVSEKGVEEVHPVEEVKQKSRDHVLCIGAGKGHEMEAILNEFPGVKVTGLDPHDYYAPPVERRLKESGREVEYKHESVRAEELKDIPDGSVEAATLFFVLHHVDRSEYPSVMAELRRVLKPGGKVFVAEDLVDSEEEQAVTVQTDRLWNLELNKSSPHNYYGVKTWTEFFEREGFRVSRVKETKPSKVRHGFFVLQRIVEKTVAESET